MKGIIPTSKEAWHFYELFSLKADLGKCWIPYLHRA
jgi:hypothetical protein